MLDTVMKSTQFTFPLAGVLLAGPILLHGAEITWDDSFSIAIPEDISNPPGSTIHEALDFNSDAGALAGDDLTINGIPFTVSTASAGAGNIVTSMTNGPAYGAAFTSVVSGDLDLDTLLDSHSYTQGSPGEVTVTINNLTPGADYQVQLIGVGDERTCCAGRTYEPDDGQGNYSTGLAMARGDIASVLGTFTADSASQTILWRSLGGAGNNDPGLSGIVVVALPDDTDTDNDGLSDAWETFWGFNPNEEDSDNNGTLDGEEDGDADNLNNLGEQAAMTDPGKADTDEDGYLDGQETNTKIWVDLNDTGSDPLNPDSDGDSLLDGTENPDDVTGSDPNEADTDTDNLPDNVEITLGYNPNDPDSDGNLVNDGDEDFDADGSTNFAELQNGTDIADDDSDDDGILDGPETNTGIWNSASDTGTNPLDNDTDNDGLLDGEENLDDNESNPHLWDTDGDLANDGYEIANGSDPLDPASTATLPTVSLRPGLIGGDLTDPEDDGIDVESDGSDPNTSGGLNFNWVSITSSSESYFTDGTVGGTNEGAFDVFDNKIGGGEAKWCCNGAPQDLTVEFADPVAITHFTMTSSNDTPGRDPSFWQIQGSNDGITFTAIYSSEGEAIWTARNQTALFILDATAPAYRFIRYSVTATNDPLHALNEIEYFGLVGGTPLEITEIKYNDDNTITLTWKSNPGRTYKIEYNTDLGDFWEGARDEIPAAGAGETLTSETFPNPSPAASKRFFRISEE